MKRFRRILFIVLFLAGSVFGIMCMSPMFRQAVFGPTYRGLPLIVWQDDFRKQHDPDFKAAPESWFRKALTWMLPKQTKLAWHELEEEDRLEILWTMTEDHQAIIRRRAVSELGPEGLLDPTSKKQLLRVVRDPKEDVVREALETIAPPTKRAKSVLVRRDGRAFGLEIPVNKITGPPLPLGELIKLRIHADSKIRQAANIIFRRHASEISPDQIETIIEQLHQAAATGSFDALEGSEFWLDLPGVAERGVYPHFEANDYFRTFALREAARSGPDEPPFPLADVVNLRNSRDAEVRLEANNYLGKYAGKLRDEHVERIISQLLEAGQRGTTEALSLPDSLRNLPGVEDRGIHSLLFSVHPKVFKDAVALCKKSPCWPANAYGAIASIVEKPNDPRFLVAYLEAVQWQDVPDDLWRAMLSLLREPEPLSRRFGIAAICKMCASTADVPAELVQMADDPDAEVRRRLAIYLTESKIRGATVRRCFLKLFAREDALSRLYLINWVSDAERDNAIASLAPALLKLEKDATDVTQRTILRGLVDIGDPEVAAKLAGELLVKATLREVRNWAKRALLKSPNIGKLHLDSLLDIARRSTDMDRAVSILAIEQICNAVPDGGKRLKASLEKSATRWIDDDDGDFQTLRNLARTEAKAKGQQAKIEDLETEVQNVHPTRRTWRRWPPFETNFEALRLDDVQYRDFLESVSKNTRLSPAMVTFLEQKLREEKDKLASRAAFEILASHPVHRKEAIPRVATALKTKNSLHHAVAITLLGDFGEHAEPLVPLLVEIMQNDGKQTRQAVMETLTQLKHHARAAVPALRQMTRSKYADARAGAATTLGAIGDRTVLPDLERLLEDSNEVVQSAARDALAAIDAPPRAKGSPDEKE